MTRMVRSSWLYVVLVTLFSGHEVASAQTLTPEIPVAALPGKLVVTVRAFRGFVQLRNRTDEPWQMPVVGMKLDGNAEFRTGPRSWVRFHVPPKQLVTLDRLGTVKVLEAIYDPAKETVKTDLAMKYGRARYDVQAAGVLLESTVHTPGNTLAIRGTKTFITNTPPFPAAVATYGGVVKHRTSSGAQVQFGDEDGQTADDGPDADDQSNDAAASMGQPGSSIPLVNNDGSGGPAETSLTNTQPVSVLLTQTAEESALALGSQGSGFTPGLIGTNLSQMRNRAGSGMATGSTIGSDAAMLLFDFTWTGAGDVDGFVTDPLGNTVCVFEDTRPNCVFSTSQGASGSVDHPGPNGSETIRWLGNQIPFGSYEYGVQLFTGQSTVPFDASVTFKPAGGEPVLLDMFSGTVSPESNEATQMIDVTSGTLEQ